MTARGSAQQQVNGESAFILANLPAAYIHIYIYIYIYIYMYIARSVTDQRYASILVSHTAARSASQEARASRRIDRRKYSLLHVAGLEASYLSHHTACSRSTALTLARRHHAS
jgi:hypothetical protein